VVQHQTYLPTALLFALPAIVSPVTDDTKDEEFDGPSQSKTHAALIVAAPPLMGTRPAWKHIGGPHKRPAVKEWLAAQPRVHLHFTPRQRVVARPG